MALTTLPAVIALTPQARASSVRVIPPEAKSAAMIALAVFLFTLGIDMGCGSIDISSFI
jgi:hypothetical protein